jgi:DNA-binding CsgD family transcriptional regulator
MTAFVMAVPSPEKSKFPNFTKRQWEISYWLWKEKTSWEIGTIVDCSEETVKKHLQQIYRKLGVNRRLAAIRALDQYKDAPQWRELSQQGF